MNSITDTSLAEKRRSLLRRLQAQRQVIALQLGPGSGMNSSYPRSRTMRFLTERPALIIRLLIGLATLLRTKQIKPQVR
jgi:hypothetical protein